MKAIRRDPSTDDRSRSDEGVTLRVVTDIQGSTYGVLLGAIKILYAHPRRPPSRVKDDRWKCLYKRKTVQSIARRSVQLFYKYVKLKLQNIKVFHHIVDVIR